MNKISLIRNLAHCLCAGTLLLNTPLFAQQACAIETSTSSYAYTGEPMAIPDATGAPPISLTINVVGAGPFIVDVNVMTDIVHTFPADLDFTVVSPAGTVVTLSSDNGGGSDDVFAGTLWDDSANPGGQVPYTSNQGLVTDHTFSNLVLASPLVPEEPLAAFIGENPNGVWTLWVDDDLGAFSGTVNTWSLFFVTTTNLPAGAVSNFSSTDGPFIIPTTAPPNVTTSTIMVSGVNTFLRNLRLTTNLTHADNAELDITVTSPNGTVVTLTTDNGSTLDNGFDGTLWDNDADPGNNVPFSAATFAASNVVSDRLFVNLVPAVTLTPEESFGAFFGENPNGVWTLTISDDTNGDGGVLDSWSLEVTAIPNQTCDFVTCEDLEFDTSPGECAAEVSIPAPETTGLCDGVVITYSVDGGPAMEGTVANLTLALGEHTILWTSTTVCGSVNCLQTITVADNEDPEINCQDIIINLDPGACDAIVSFDVVATDNCMQTPGLPWQVPPMLLPHGGGALVVAANDLPGGFMFDLTNNTAQIVSIQALEVRFGTAGLAGTGEIPAIAPVSVYATTGNTHAGQQMNPGAWETIAFEVPVMVAGENSELSMFPLPGLGILLSPGQTRGVFVFGVTHSLLYNSAGNSTVVPFTNGDLSLVSGNSISGLFSGTTFAPRTPNIVFHYGVGLNAIVNQTEGLPSGSIFPIGTTTNCFVATDAAGNTSTCCFDVIVNEYSGPILTSLTCNNLVNVSLDDDCEAIIGADQILEGGAYFCYDDYIVNVDQYEDLDVNGVSLTYSLGLHTVTVTDPNTGNNCWGQILIEDKLPPTITCTDFTLNCGESLEPVFTPQVTGVVHCGASASDPIGPALAGFTLTCDVNIPDGFKITDVNVCIGITHTDIGNISLQLVSPFGDVTDLWGDPDGVFGQCFTFDNMFVSFDDEGPASALCADISGSPDCNMLVRPVATQNAPQFGLPSPSLNQYIGDNPNGTWSLIVNQSITGGSGTLNFWDVEISYAQSGAFAPSTDDNCDNDVGLSYTDQEVGELCDTLEILRTWTATDDSGNTATCVQTLTILPLDVQSVECPPDYYGVCGDNVHPAFTGGYPTVGGFPIMPGGFCNIFVAYWDKEFEDCGGGTKIERTWEVLDWCTGTTVQCTQLIKLVDEEGPWLDCPEEIILSTDPWFCHADVEIWVDATDHCESYPLEYSLSINGGDQIYLGGVSHYELKDLLLGYHIAVWTVTDACGNSSTCVTEIHVKDNIEPVAVCDEHTILALTFDDPLDEGLTKLHAETLDDGSYDNCSDVTFLARRMPPPVPPPFGPSCIDFDWISNSEPYMEYPNNDGGLPESIDLGYTFQPWVPFACCDVGKMVLVELMVTDEAGNTNTCMVEVEVQDKLRPYLECPPDITVGCDFWFDAHETNGFVDTDGLEDVFGRVLDAYEYDEDDREPIIINDPSPGSPYYLQDHLWGYDGWADDNCDVTITVDTDIDDDCSGEELPGNAPDDAVRLIRRTFRATDGAGNRQTCTQRIWVVDFDRFHITDVVCGLWPGGDDVRWPCDLTITDCPQGELTPENLSQYAPNNAPLVHDDNCSLIGITYEDQVFYFVDNACFKIVRKWTIIDWCQFEVNPSGGHYGYWTYVQVIKVHDNTPPVFENCPDGPVVYCVDDPNVELPSTNQVFLGEGNPGSSSCSAHVREELVVIETCSDKVIYDVKLYGRYPNPDQFDQIVAKTTVDVNTGSGTATLSWDTRTSTLPPSHTIRRHGLEYNDRHCSNWPSAGGVKDYYRILWTVEDGCGNISTCEYLLRLEDCKKPSPVCVGLSSVVMPNSGSVTIWAVDFDASSFDDCTPHDDLLFSFSGTTYQPSRVFDCDAIAANGSPSFLVEIWVADEGNDQNCNGFVQPIGIEWSERNKDYCTTFIVIDDNEEVCGGGPGIAGTIETEELEAVAQATVTLRDPANGQVFGTYTTGQNGLYHMINPLLNGELSSVRGDNHKNGVSTLDLVKVQKHLLGIQLLDSPYKLIAADANNSQSVSALDLVEIRKLILGIYNEFPKNESWRFVDASFEFSDPAHPWPFDEVLNVQTAQGSGFDFVGVKIGDVNGNVVANATQVQTRNTDGVLEFTTDVETVKAGEAITVPVSASNFAQILGYQFTMKTAGLILTSVEAGALDMSAENIGIHDGAITVSWNKVAPVSSTDVLFTFNFTVSQSGILSEMLSIDSETKLTEAEAYNGNEDLLDVTLTFRNGGVAVGKEFALFQNEPNPFETNTVVSFTLPQAMDATLTVFDVTGKVVHAIEGSYAQGFNQISVHRKNLGSAGVMYYRLDASPFSATKKMVLID